MQDVEDDILDELQAIRAALTDPNRQADVVPSNDAVVVGNEQWEDETVEEIDFGAQTDNGTELQPGEELVAAEVRSNRRNVSAMLRAVGVSTHPGDINGDGQDESIIQYRFERIESVSDGWNDLPGLTTTAPFGAVGAPVEVIPGTFVGPSSAFRIVFENRSDGFSNPISVNLDEIGAQMHARIVRGGL